MGRDRWIWPILLLAGGLRLASVWLIPNEQYSDSVWYDGAAANLALHGFYGLDSPSAWFPPGYPFLLTVLYWLVGHNELAGKLANVALGVLLCGGTFLLGRVTTGTTGGLVGALLIALWPNLIFHTNILSSDVLAACGFVFALWLAMRPPTGPRWLTALGLGLLIGWMVLVRPVSLILLAAVGLWWWLRDRSLRRAIVQLVPVTALVLLIVGAWTVRNYAQFGQVITIATNGGYNFWQTNHRYADGNDTFWQVVPMDDPEYRTMADGDEFTKNREGYRYALAFLREHPTHLLTMLPTKLFWLYHTDTSGLYEGALDAPLTAPGAPALWLRAHERLAEAATFRYYEVVLALAVAGTAYLLLTSRPRWLWPLLSLPLLLTFFHLFFHAKDRFHIPLDGIFALLAAVALVAAVRRVRSLVRRRARASLTPSSVSPA
jgi:4-amino-4-deoxy-L-arabinose transferase-like glycosyltransferase